MPRPPDIPPVSTSRPPDRNENQDSCSLQGNNDWFQSFVQSSSLPYQSLDPHGRFLDVNSAWLTTLGYSREEVIGRWFGDVLPPDLRPVFEENFSRFQAAGKINGVEFRLRGKTGQTVHAIFDGLWQRDPHGNLLRSHCFFHDVTDIRKNEEQTRFHSMLLDQIADRITATDLQGTITYVNQAECNTSKRTREELLGQSVALYGEDPQRGATQKLIIDTTLQNGAWQGEVVNYASDGSERIVHCRTSLIRDEKGHPLGMCGIGTDITRQKQSEINQKLAIEILEILNHSGQKLDLIRRILLKIKQATEVEAVGLRLKDGDDYPYYIANGFPDDFLQSEKFLCQYTENGQIRRDEQGFAPLACLCGVVIRGQSDPARSFFTPGGSFWTNNRSALIPSPELDPYRDRIRGRCVNQGFESVALIPLRSGPEIIGLLQLNDPQKNKFTPEQIQFFEGIGASIGIAIARKQAEESTRRERDKAQSYLDVAGTMMIVIDAGQNITLFNKKACEILQTDADSMIGKNWFDTFLPENSREQVRAVFQDIISGNIQPWEYVENKALTCTGEERLIAWHNSVLRDENGAIIATLSSGEDITEQKRTEDALKESEERLRLATKATNDVIWDWDILHDSQRWNEAGISVFGWSDIVESPQTAAWWVERVHPDDRKRVSDAFHAAVENPSCNHWQDEYRFRKADGAYADVLDRGYIMRNPQGRAIRMIGAMLDLTERKRVEKALQERERTWATLIGNLPGFVYRCANDHDWTMQYISQGCRDVTGYSPEEFLHNKKLAFNDIVHPDYREPLWKIWQEILQKRLPFEQEYPIINAAGETRWVWERGQGVFADDGQLLFLEGFITDITDRKRAEEDVRESKARLEMAVHASNVGLWNWDIQSNTVYYSPEYKRQIGYEDHEISNSFHEWKDRVHPDDLDRTLETVNRFIQSPWPNYEIEFRFRHKDGSYRWILARASLLHDADGNPSRMLGAHLDITERKNAEEALLASEETFSRAFNSGALMMTISDVETGEYRIVNDTFTRISGFSREEAVGKTSIELGWISREDRQRLKQEMISRGRVSAMELTLKHKNGNPVPCLYFGEMITIAGKKQLLSIVEDITERKRVEMELFASERRFREVLENVNMIAVELNRGGTITFCNDCLLDLTGWTWEELIGQNWFERFIPPTNQQKMRDIHADIIQAGTQFLHFENPILTRQGELRYITWDNTQQWNAAGDVIGIVSLGKDITESKKARDELNAAYLKLEAMWGIAAMADADFKSICDHILDTIVRMTGSQFGFYGFLNEDESAMLIHAWSGEAMKGCSMVNKPQHFPIREAGVWAEAVRQRKPFILNHYENAHPAKKGCPEGHVPLTNLMAIPLFSSGKIISVAAVANRSAHYGQDDVNQITAFLNGIQSIMERKWAEEALRESERFARSTLDGLSAHIAIVNQNGVIEAVNKAWRDFASDNGPLTGNACEGANYLKICDNVSGDHFESAAEFAQALRDVLNGQREFFEMEYPCHSPDQKRWFSVRVTPFPGAGPARAVIAHLDITQRMHAEEKLRKSESQYRALFNDSPVGIVLLRRPDYVLAANEAFCRITGRTLEVLQRNPVQICYSDPQDHQKLLDLLDQQDAIYNREISGQRENGQQFWCRMNVIKIPELGPDMLLGIIEDITEQKKIEEELQQRRFELAHANRLSTIGEMASCLAHEMNQPLTGISILAGGCLRTMESTRTVSQDLINALEEIVAQTAQAGKVINSIKHFIRKDDPEQQRLNINTIIRDAVQLISPECQNQKVTLRVSLAEALPPVFADPTQIEQIIVNLIHNSIEAMERTPIPMKTIRIQSVLQEPDSVEIRISDQGCGIPAELESKIFESFYTTKRKGVGLGLPLCRSIIETHGGKIGMTPNPEQGVTFHFTLPLLQPGK